MFNTRWLDDGEALDAVTARLGSNGSYTGVVGALKSIGQEKGENVDWLNASSVQLAIRDQIAQGGDAHAVLVAAFNASRQLLKPLTPQEDLVFQSFLFELAIRRVTCSEACPRDTCPDDKRQLAEEAINRVCAGTNFSVHQICDLVLRHEMREKHLAVK